MAYPELLLVGAPGRLEVETLIPFTGLAGKKVDSVVSSGRRPLQSATC
ncbi:hypothetical protein I6N95_21055 [Vagococcus sp. BWB3-3]|uniref:Uncharacterized protein n=1 Tax=Vagococcus allomyrinae TaxID=2794353 RepID=A0A940PGI2_9ENTE|nr:hypothetical protein [Vagococcus allomyrinae]MBP1043518.1 hypothetical protein [Vagococcus allomyrinae]